MRASTLCEGLTWALLWGCAAGGGALEAARDEDPREAELGADAAPHEPESSPPASTAASREPLFADEAIAPLSPSEAERCQKVDFLYVVDNSASMMDKQANLARSFEGFSRIVQDTLGTTDHQILVVDTDDFNVGNMARGVHQPAQGDVCARVLGAGLRSGAAGESCGVAGAQRFLRDDQPHLARTFSCLARVGTLGSVDERPIEALLAATGALGNEAAACNRGFLRQDAILVVTLITDEEDIESHGDPDGWRRDLIEVKHGRARSIVMLGLIADNHLRGGLPGGPCDELSGSPSPRLQRFVESFEHGSLGSVCAADYSAFFAEAVSSIDTACAAFEPLR